MLVLVADAVAGDGAGDARLLCARRPRPDPSSPASARKVFAVRIGAHRALDHARWRCRWRRRSSTCSPMLGGPRWLGAYGVAVAMGLAATALRRRADGRAVPHDRAAAHAARRPDRRGGGRRRLRHRRAGRRDPLYGNTLSRFAACAVGRAHRASRRTSDSPFWWPARAIMGDSPALAGVLVVRLRAARRRRRRLLAALRRARDRRRQRFGRGDRAGGSVQQRASARRRRRARCGARNGRFCGAIPGWSRRR